MKFLAPKLALIVNIKKILVKAVVRDVERYKLYSVFILAESEKFLLCRALLMYVSFLTYHSKMIFSARRNTKQFERVKEKEESSYS